MKLEYSINKNKHSILFCKDDNIKKMSQVLANFETDKNVLFLFDSKIDKKIVEKIIFIFELINESYEIIRLSIFSSKSLLLALTEYAIS